jgi:hypothetical protein
LLIFFDTRVHIQTTCAVFNSAARRLLIATDNGGVHVYTVDVQQPTTSADAGGGAGGVRTCTLQRRLYVHDACVTAMDVCTEYSVIVTGDAHGYVVISDLNKSVRACLQCV